MSSFSRRIGLFEDEGWKALLPFTRTRPIWAFWWGMDTLAEKWQRYFGWEVVGFWPAQKALQVCYPPIVPPGPVLWINARLLPHSPEINRWLETLPPNTLFRTAEGTPVALYTDRLPTLIADNNFPFSAFPDAEVPPEVSLRWLRQNTDLFHLTGEIIYADWQHWRQRSAPLPTTLSVRGKDNLFLHPTARTGFACISAEEGPVWIGPHAELQDGVLLQHTNTVGPHTTLMLGAKIRTHNSFGPYCKIGGEVGQTTFLGYANKAHDGFFGHSVIGTWCNIGAGSNTSNLKNTYGPVLLYVPATGQLRDTGLQFCGLLMGDYARCGIQTPFTTGCVVDVFANVVSTTFTPKYIPPFSWAPGQFWSWEKVREAAERMQRRRGRTLSESETKLLRHLWETLTQSPTGGQTV